MNNSLDDSLKRISKVNIGQAIMLVFIIFIEVKEVVGVIINTKKAVEIFSLSLQLSDNLIMPESCYPTFVIIAFIAYIIVTTYQLFDDED